MPPAILTLRVIVMFRLTCAALLAAAALGVTPATAGAAPALDTNLGALWTTVLQTPSAQNPFGSGDPAAGCFHLGHTLAPFGPTGIPACTVKTGTRIFVVGASVECSTFEGNGTTEAELRNCARQNDVQVAPAVSVDGKAVSVTEVETQLLHIVLPADNIFGLPPGTQGLSVGHGWVVLLHPLTPGTHTIVINSAGSTITTTITVEPGH
jgi:hypothetical protein